MGAQITLLVNRVTYIRPIRSVVSRAIGAVTNRYYMLLCPMNLRAQDLQNAPLTPNKSPSFPDVVMRSFWGSPGLGSFLGSGQGSKVYIYIYMYIYISRFL